MLFLMKVPLFAMAQLVSVSASNTNSKLSKIVVLKIKNNSISQKIINLTSYFLKIRRPTHILCPP